MNGRGKLIETAFDKLTYKIIGCAMAGHRSLGPGLREDAYQRDLEARLTQAGLCYEPQKRYEVLDPEMEDCFIGYYIPDFVVEGSVVVEIKALTRLEKTHLAQVIGYLAVSNCPLGLLINFGERSLRFHRILPPKDIAEHRINRQWLFVPGWLSTEDT